MDGPIAVASKLRPCWLLVPLPVAARALASRNKAVNCSVCMIETALLETVDKSTAFRYPYYLVGMFVCSNRAQTYVVDMI
jgi:hypothetical protein